jgi:uncharacterized membrane protein YebE (DUF533 family)
MSATTSTTLLPKEAYLALAAVGWADGRITQNEKTGIARAAREAGLGGDELGAVERALEAKVTLDEFVPGDMSDWQRVVTYALACWLACLDGVQSADESETLAGLAKRLDLSQGVAQRASAAAFDVSVLPEGGRPDKFDFVKLEARLREKLPQVSR